MNSSKSRPLLAACVVLLVVASVALTACAPPHAPAPVAEEAPSEAEEVLVEEEAPEEEAPPPQAEQPPDVSAPDADEQLAEAASQSTRLVIKDGFITLHVEDIDTAMAEASAIAGRYGGYVLSSESTQGTRSQSAEITITVRSEDFDTALAELRAIAIEVLDEVVEGQDVSSEFVDLESRLRNLEATAERLRGFLDDAQSVEEALKINEELAAIEAEIEEVRGRMNYLQTRAAMSTITISLLTDPRPTPTPTTTPTPTNTPTPTLTPTPTPWNPGDAVRDAAHTERNILRLMLHRVTDVLIFVGVIVVPTLLPFVGLFFIGRAGLRWWRRRREEDTGSEEDVSS